MINHLRFNWGIYESDICFFGGSVKYTGNVVARSRRSVLEEAEILFLGTHCIVWMERFRHGNAALVAFVRNGSVVSKEDFKDHYPAHEFLKAFEACCGKSELYAEIHFFRRAKQYFTGLLQIFCVVSALIALGMCPQTNHVVSCLLIVLLSFFLFIFLSTLYKYYRNVDYKNYKSRLFDDAEH